RRVAAAKPAISGRSNCQSCEGSCGAPSACESKSASYPLRTGNSTHAVSRSESAPTLNCCSSPIAMLNRYIGNKNVIIDEILGVVGTHARPGSLVCDAFSGSLAVSLALKREGYRVAANDINRFSAIYGR